ncbi:hypothetical protein [Frankia sp. AgB32]|uniref:hypothetical protein n=1 Tax=Frankia sp. AgB32 TaxID=631119 RepID=UPI00200EC605|nr:hypothetical protein [Frankia sp. AgB32]MCK9896261.1 hypothetical protein [Frankia sp. AgB32]
MLIPLPATLDPVAVASMSDNIPDGWRTVGPYAHELAALGAHVDYVDTDPQRLAAAEQFGANPVDAKLPDPKADPYPVTVSTSANPASLAATLKATWPYGVCTDTGIYYGGTFDLPIFDLYGTGIRFVTGRVNARADIPHVLDLLAIGLDLRPAVETVADWESAPQTWAALRGKTVLTRG